MKTIQKLALVLIGLVALVAINACTADEPVVVDDDQTKVDVDDFEHVEDDGALIDWSFIASVARGDVDTHFLPVVSTIFEEKKCDSANGINGEWVKSTPLIGLGAIFDDYFVIKGQTMEPLVLTGCVADYSIVYYPWKQYRAETGFDKRIFISSKFEYDQEKQTISIPRGEFSVLRTKGNELTVCYELDYYDFETATIRPMNVRVVGTYTCEPCAINDDEYLCYETEKDAKIAMVKMMREYFGDVVYLDSDDPDWSFGSFLYYYPMINLAALQEDLENDRDEWYSWELEYANSKASE